MFAIRKHLILTRQVGAAGIHQIDARQAVLLGDRLGAQMLLYGQWVIGTAFDRGIVGDDHAFDALDPADSGDHPSSRYLFAVHLMCSQLADFQKRRTGVQQTVDTLARQQLAA